MPKDEHCAFCWLSVVIIDRARSEQRKVMRIYVKETLLAIISFFITDRFWDFRPYRLIGGQRRFLGVQSIYI